MDAKEILSKHTGETGIYLTKGQIRGSDAIEAMEEYATLRTQSIQDKVKELESELTKFTEVSNKHINDLDSLIVELQSALTESKLREERLAIEFAEWLSDNEWTKKIFTHPNKVGQYYSMQFGYKPIQELYSIFILSNQPDKNEENQIYIKKSAINPYFNLYGNCGTNNKHNSGKGRL